MFIVTGGSRHLPMTAKPYALIALVGCAALLPNAASAGCGMSTLELPITMHGMTPVVPAQINDTPVRFILDSGAFYSMISPAAAQRLNLPKTRTPNVTVTGAGGEVDVYLALVKKFTLENVALPPIEFLVGGNDFGGVIGLLGRNVLGIADMEYDFANGVARITRPNADCKNVLLAYWAKSQPVSMATMSGWANLRNKGTMITVTVNGVPMRTLLDTGANSTMLSASAARRAGLARDGEGVVRAASVYGVGRHEVKSWIAPIKTITIGKETINDAHLTFSDYEPDGVDLTLGADFFLSHRIYVANSQRLVYITSNGGGTGFELKTPATTSVAGGETEGSQVETTPLADADAYARRGAAFAARKEYARALADLNRACEMDPEASSYFSTRADIHFRLKRPDLAMADLDESLRLDPDSAGVRLFRARLHAKNDNKTAAEADLAAADKLAAPQAGMRTSIGDMYLELGHAEAAVTQYNLWLESHPGDVAFPSVLNDRCWARALTNKELEKALDDCNQSIKARPNEPDHFTSRGLVYYREGWIDRALADYERALKSDAKSAWALYGRGLVHLKKRANEEGRADIAAAEAIQPGITKEAKQYGIE